MRILYVINGFDPGGAEHGLLTLLRAGFFAGHDLKVIGFCRGRGDLAGRIRQEVGDENLLIASDEEMLSLRGILAGGAAFFRLLYRWRPDVAVLSLKQANVVGRLVLSLFPKVFCVSFEHIARYRARRGERLYGALLRLLSYRVDGVWADCRETLDATRAYFTPRARLENVVPLFVADASVAQKTSYVLGAQARLVAAGRLVDRKNIDAIIKALKLLHDRGVAARLEIFGDGPKLADLQALAARLALDEQVHFYGYKADWLEFASAGNIFINAGDTEGFCIVAAEAMLAGLPVVAVDVGGIREYGVHETNMMKLASADPEDLAGVLAKLLSSEDQRRRIGKAARADMLVGYSANALRECACGIFPR